ncbi:hypothetical protein N8611_00750 [bacterium]|nr:hypothetical protein [bacterium]
MNMKNRLGRTLLMGIAASLLHVGSDVHAAETLEIDQAVELRFQTRSGKKYTLQGSNDFNSWKTIGKAGYGNGGIQKRFVSVDDASENLKFFRLEVLEESNVGFAPVSIVGARYILNTGGFPETIDFRAIGEAERASANGTSLAKFQYSKTDDDRARLELFEGMGRELYLIEYTGSEAGAFRLETYRGEQLDDVDVGTFTVQTAISAPPVPGGVNAPPLPTAGQGGVAKSQLSGLSFVFHDGGEPIWLQFEDASNGRAIDDDDLLPFTYLIEPVSEAEQILRVDLDGDEELEFYLSYSGECSGTYILRETENGELDDVDMGTFSVSSEPIPVHHGDDDDDEGDHDGDDDDGEGDHDGDDDDDDDDDDEFPFIEENGGTFSIEHEEGGVDQNGEKDVYPLVAILSGTARSEKLQGFESDDTVTGGSGSDLFPLTTGDDLITDFDPSVDMIDVGDFARASDGFGVLVSLVAIAENSSEIVDERGVKALVIDVDGKLGDSTTTILGVGIADLTEDNVFFGLGGSSIPPLEFTHIAEFLVTYSNGDVVLFPAHDLKRHPIEGQLISQGLGNN